jgi:Na+/phosphate symporter
METNDVKKTDWRYISGLVILLVGLISLIIPPLSLAMVIIGTALIFFSKKSMLTKVLTIIVPVALSVLSLFN